MWNIANAHVIHLSLFHHCHNPNLYCSHPLFLAATAGHALRMLFAIMQHACLHACLSYSDRVLSACFLFALSFRLAGLLNAFVLFSCC